MSFTNTEVNALLTDLDTKAGVYAYLSAPANTTTTAAATWYPIAGTFVNDFENFIFDTDHIEYSGTVDQEFEIDWHVSLKTDTIGTTCHVTANLNGSPVAGGIMGTTMKETGEEYAFSGTMMVTLSTNDEIQLVLSSDKVGAVITVEHLTTTINKFHATRV